MLHHHRRGGRYRASQVASIGFAQTGPCLPEGSDEVFRDLASFWHELGGDALRVLAFQEAV